MKFERPEDEKRVWGTLQTNEIPLKNLLVWLLKKEEKKLQFKGIICLLCWRA